jgi:hypothetical protein
MERVMDELARESENIDENDPRQLARMMRKLHDQAGLPLDAKAEEAIRRMEAGESPEKIEEEMGDVFEGEGGEIDESGGRLRGLIRKSPPAVDHTLYDL